MSRLVCVKTFGSRAEADIARLALESESIEAVVASDDAGGMLLELSKSGVRLLVPEEDLADARAAISDTDYESSPEVVSEGSEASRRFRALGYALAATGLFGVAALGMAEGWSIWPPLVLGLLGIFAVARAILLARRDLRWRPRDEPAK